MKFSDTDIYPVITGHFCGSRSSEYVAEQILAGGARIIQMREKDACSQELLEMAIIFRKITLRYNALLIINDRVDIALAAGADGVHLGQSDMPVAAARKIAPGLIIGASCHSLQHAVHATDAGASYVNIGPIYPTKTKEKLTNFLGPQEVAKIAPCLKIPFSVMGGIKRSNIQELLDAGAQHIAMVTEITQADNIKERVREIRQMIQNSQSI